MADTKISALTAATTPLAGTEVLPIVQSGTTKQVSVANLTAGRAISADSLTLTGSPLPATSGGTGQSSFAVGDLLYASTTTALSKLADVATGNALISGGVGVAPSWGKIGLATHVSGTLPVGNGGTGTATAFTAGSVVYAGASGVYSQDNANFFWDGTNHRLGIGNATPSYLLHVTRGASSGVVAAFGRASGATGYIYTASDSAFFSSDALADNAWGCIPGTNSLGAWTSGTQSLGIGSTGDVTFNRGNLVQGTAAKGINFTANTGAAGMTSQLLNWYEEGTWTPTITPSTSGAVTYTTQNGTYTRVGRQVTIVFTVAGTKNTASGDFRIGGIPFNMSSTITGAINWYNPSGTALVNAVAFYYSASQFRVGVITAANTDATNGTFGSTHVSSTFSLTGTLTYFV
jgi:hypothetical protein